MARARFAFHLFVWIFTLSKYNVYGEEKDVHYQQNATFTDNQALILTPLIEAGKIKEAQDAAAVTDIPEMQNRTSYSGYFNVDKDISTNLFFWYFPAKHDHENAPVLLWLQGGPGRSSLRGLFMENGPFYIEDGVLNERNISWADHHSVLYLDSPAGAGFSHTGVWGNRITLSTIADGLYNAILQFFQLFPDLLKNSFYIAGQSYGGKYVPAIAHLIHRSNPAATVKINLAGIAIGNGLVDPETQLRYSEYLYQIGLVNLKGRHELEENEHKMVKQIKSKKWRHAYVSYSRIILNYLESLYKKLTGFTNVASLLEPTMLYDKEMYMSLYVGQPKIRRAIHAGNSSYYPSSGFVQYLLIEDMMQSVAPLLSELIDNYKVLIYNGQLDIIIPYCTTVDYLRKLKFNGSENYDDADRIHWYVNATLAGYVTHVGNLTEIMVRNAGHSVPEDQIVWATDMLYRFTRSLPFTTPQIPRVGR